MPRLMWILCLPLVVLATWGCGVVTDPVTAKAPTQEPINPRLLGRTVNVAFIWDKNDSRYEPALEGAQKSINALSHSTQLDLKLKEYAYQGADASRALEQAIGAKCDAVLLEPSGASELKRTLIAAKSADIPIFTMGNDLPKAYRVYFSGAQDTLLARRLGYEVGGKATGDAILTAFVAPGEEALAEAAKEGLSRNPKTRWRTLRLSSSDTAAEAVRDMLRQSECHQWIFFKGDAISNDSAFTKLVGTQHKVYTLGCEPKHLALLQADVVRCLIVPSYESGYSAGYRAIEYLAYGRKPAEAPLATPLVEAQNTSKVALMLRRWGFTDIPGEYVAALKGEGREN